MNRSVTIAGILMLLYYCSACERKPYVEHKLKFENTGKGCSELENRFSMISNFGGERFEFQKCLSADFTAAQMNVSRQGDTVVVHFPGSVTSEGKVFQVTLDIDSYPKYHFITIDEDTYSIVQALNK